MTTEKTIGVVGASGLVGSNIVRAGLERGYTVHGTMRDRNAPDKAPFLNALPGAPTGLQLFAFDGVPASVCSYEDSAIRAFTMARIWSE